MQRDATGRLKCHFRKGVHQTRHGLIGTEQRCLNTKTLRRPFVVGLDLAAPLKQMGTGGHEQGGLIEQI